MKKSIIINICVVFLSALILAACAGSLPVPGGTDTTNEGFYQSKQALLGRLSVLKPGMSESQVFVALERKKEELVYLERQQVASALYGSNALQFDHKGPASEPGSAEFMQALYGYRLDYKSVERDHGFSSPIRIKTHEQGFEYSVILVFRNGILFAEPILKGGVVNRTSSSTIFDFLNPGTLVDAAK